MKFSGIFVYNYYIKINKNISIMTTENKNSKELIQSILETMAPAIDKLTNQVSDKFDETKNLFDSIFSGLCSNEHYLADHKSITDEYNQFVDVYSGIASGDCKSQTCTIEEAQKALAFNKTYFDKRTISLPRIHLYNEYLKYHGCENSIKPSPKSKLILQSVEFEWFRYFVSKTLSNKNYCFDEYKETTIKEIVNDALNKLLTVASKKLNPILDEQIIESVELSGSGNTNNVFYGKWKIKTNVSSYFFKTQITEAGGYNVQQFHLRYLSSIKEIKSKIK